MLSSEIQVPGRLSPITKVLARIAAADLETLANCPQRDVDAVGAVAGIMLLTAVYQTSLFIVVGHRLFAVPGRLDLMIVGVAAFIAFFILKIDAYTIMRSGWHLNGIAELKRGGLDVSGGPIARFKAACLLVIRILLALGIAQLTAIFVSILVFGHDIDARIDSDFSRANAPLIAAAGARADADIQRQREAVINVINELSAAGGEAEALRKRELDLASSEPKLQEAQQEVAQLVAAKTRADDELQEAENFAINEAAGIKGAPNNSGQVGEGVRYRAASERVANAKAHVAELATALDQARARQEVLAKAFAARTDDARGQIEGQLASVEKSVANGQTRLAALNQHLDQLVLGREAAIRTAVTSSADYVPRKDGLLIQLTALRDIADGNPEIGLVILLIDVTSFGFELAAVLAKVTSFVPTGYAAYLARDAYMLTVSIVDGMVHDLERRSPAEESQPETLGQMPDLEVANDNALDPDPTAEATFDDPDDTPPSPPEPSKRPRGRPRKAPAE